MTSVSGVEVPESVKTAVEDVRTKKYLYIVFHVVKKGIKDVWEIKSSKPPIEGTKNNKQIDEDPFRTFYEEFVKEEIQSDYPIFAIFDFGGLKGAGLNLVSFQWCPDECPVKSKLVFATSIGALKKLASDCACQETNDYDDVTFEKIKKLKGKK